MSKQFNTGALRRVGMVALSLLLIFTVISYPISVRAETFGTNDFFDFNDYSKYDYDGSLVKVTTVLPDWYITREMSSGATYYGKDVTFTADIYYDIFILGSPFGLNPTGADVSNGHLFDLFKMPSSFVLTNEFHLTQQFISSANWMPTTPYWIYYYVDVDGNILDTGYLPNTYAKETLVNGYVTYDIKFEFSTENYPIPETARGLYFTFEYRNEAYDGTYTFNISYEPFVITFDIDDPNFNMREDISQIRDKLDDIANGTPEQNQQAQDAIDGLNSSTDKLGQLGDTMSSVEKPSIDSSQISAGSLVPSTSLVVLSSPFQALWENKQLLAMLTIVVTLVLVSWVFFGKKG